jgi:hypothetical protein
MDLSDFIHRNIEKELLDLGHSRAISKSCADSARSEYQNGCNWKMGTVYKVLSTKAKKLAGKVKKKAEAKK